MSTFKYDLSVRSFSPVRRKNYQYRVNANKVRDLYKKIKFVTQPVRTKQWAKVKLAKLVNKLNDKSLIPDNLGNIIISASVGDTIKSGFPNLSMEVVLRGDDKEIDDKEWDKMWWHK